ncbi:MAG TPA: class I SAM-dependent methyltransferase [Nitrospira sp.]|nr:class I SAM-dependent methyltransferase [Nitrospira sp.]
MAVSVSLDSVKRFWESHPVAAAAVPFPIGAPDYFQYYDRLRQANESVEFSYDLHEYKQHKGHRVLDVGCGNGYVLSRYAKEGADVYGVDLTETGIRLCRQRFALSDLHGQFTVGSAEDLPYPDNAFDVVCSMGVLHHTPDTAKAVAEVFRVLKPGGRLIVMFYHRNSAKFRLNLFLRRLLQFRDLQQLVNEVDGHGNPKGDVYSERELRNLLKRFENLSIFAGFLRGTHFLPVIGRIIPNSWLKPFEPRLGWFLYAKGVKPPHAFPTI